MPKSSENLWKFWEELGNLRDFPKTSKTPQTRFWGVSWRFMKLLENFGNSSKVFSRCFYDFLKCSENLQKSSEVFWKSSEISENFGNGSKVIFRCFYDFLKFSENLRKSSEVFGNLRKFSENFGNGSKVIFRCLWLFKIFVKSSEVFGNVRKSSETISGCDRKCS